ncbi:MAG: hypothetical protein QXZ02_03200 [Candidatus Bathyarchaeia archaeon]
MESFKILPVLVCRKGQVNENFMGKRIEQLREKLKINVQILEHAVINEEKEVSP